MTIFGGKVVGLDLELLDRIHGWDVGDAIAADVAAKVADVVVHAVEENVIGRVPAAAGDKGQVGGEAAERRGAPGKQSKKKGIAAVQRQLDNAPVFDDLAQRGGLCLEQRGGGLNDDGL